MSIHEFVVLNHRDFAGFFSQHFSFGFSTSNNASYFAVHVRLGGLRSSKLRVFVGISLGCSRRSLRVLVGIIVGAVPSVWLVGVYWVCVVVLFGFCRGLGVFNVFEVGL